MTALSLIEITQDDLEQMSFNTGIPFELAADHAWLRLGDTTFIAPYEVTT